VDTATGLISQANVIAFSLAAKMHIAPDPHPISNTFLPVND
jgi:hypothetical protein